MEILKAANKMSAKSKVCVREKEGEREKEKRHGDMVATATVSLCWWQL